MKTKKRWLLLPMVLGCLVIGMFAGCGHEQNKEEENEQQSFESGGTGSKVYGAEEASTGGDLEASTQSAEADASAGDGQTTEEVKLNIAYAEESAAVAAEELAQEENTSATNDELLQEENASATKEESVQEAVPLQEESLGEVESSEVYEVSQPYYLTETDKEQVLMQLAELGQQYGLTYYSDISEGETWDSPTPIYEEELILGRDHVMNAMVEYTEGAFVLMQMENCQGFALSIKERPFTMTDACYEVYVYWI